MIKEIEITAKSYDEAVADAVAQLGAPNTEALTVTVLQEAKKGFLGLGGTPAIIKAVYDAPEADKAPSDKAAKKAAEAGRIIPLEEAGVSATASWRAWPRTWVLR